MFKQTRNTMERAIVGFGLDGDLAGIGELDGVADEIDQNLRQAAAVATAGRQLWGNLDFETKLLVRRQRLKRAANGLRDVLNGIIGEFEHKLASLDLGQIQHVIDEPE
jgi:hypothetical protein